jgi:hypothetical protein
MTSLKGGGDAFAVELRGRFHEQGVVPILRDRVPERSRHGDLELASEAARPEFDEEGTESVPLK